MSGELNSMQESIKLALDAADAATDVTSEYSQVKREHKKLEAKVPQIAPRDLLIKFTET